MRDEGQHRRGTPNGTADPAPATDEQTVTCPTCKGRAAWHGNPHRPFCGLVCRLIDLGAWLDERYRVTSKDTPSDVP